MLKAQVGAMQTSPPSAAVRRLHILIDQKQTERTCEGPQRYYLLLVVATIIYSHSSPNTAGPFRDVSLSKYRGMER